MTMTERADQMKATATFKLSNPLKRCPLSFSVLHIFLFNSIFHAYLPRTLPQFLYPISFDCNGGKSQYWSSCTTDDFSEQAPTDHNVGYNSWGRVLWPGVDQTLLSSIFRPTSSYDLDISCYGKKQLILNAELYGANGGLEIN